MWNLLLFVVLCFASPLSWAVNGLDVSLANNKILLTPRHGGDGSAWGMARCESCHVLNLIHRDAPKIRDIARNKGPEACSGCHGANGTEMQRPCVICHNAVDLPKSPLQQSPHKHDFKFGTTQNLADKDCLVCHDASDMDGQFENNVDLTLLPDRGGVKSEYRNSAEFCLRCHNRDHQQPGFTMLDRDYRDDLIAMEDNWRFIDKHGYPKGSGQRTYAGLRDDVYQYASVVECTDCHAMHGTQNQKLLIDTSASGVFRFGQNVRQLPYGVDIRGNDYSQLCVLCHAMQTPLDDALRNTGNGLTGVHQVGGDCMTCHAHGMAAQTGL